MKFLCANNNIELMIKIFKFRYNIFCLEKGFIDKNGLIDQIETDDYDNHSSHFAAIDCHGEIAGYLRLIHKRGGILPIEKIPLDHFNPAVNSLLHNTSEISRLSIHKNYRSRINPVVSTKIQQGLYKIVYEASRTLGLTHLCAIMEKPLHKTLYNASIRFKQIGPNFYDHGIVAPYLCNINHVCCDLYHTASRFQTICTEKSRQPAACYIC